LKRRTFLLAEPVVGLNRETLLMHLNQLMSVHNVVLEGGRVSIDYDLLEVHAEQIEAVLIKAGASMGAGWATRFKRSWIHYIEETELDNLAASDAACCNKAPAKV